MPTYEGSGRLAEKGVLVTGAGTGIGEAVAKLFAQEGAIVACNSLPDDPLDKVVSEIESAGGRAFACIGDLGVQAEAKRVVDEAVEALGGLDIVISNHAFFGVLASVPDYPDEVFHAMAHSTVNGTYYLTKYTLPHLRKTQGNMVFTGSTVALHGQLGNAPYGASKGWVNAWALGLAAAEAQYGIRVNVVAPGPIDTTMTNAKEDGGSMDAETAGLVYKWTLQARRGTTQECAAPYLFLASDEASFITGSVYRVDGGMIIAHGPIADEVPDDLRGQPETTLGIKHNMDGVGYRDIAASK